MSRVVSITYSPACDQRQPPDRYHRVAVEQARLVKGWGIENDLKGSRGKRQLNVMSATTLERLDVFGLETAPGAMGEQIVLDGIDVAGLPEGTQLSLGDAVIELGELRTGCRRLETIQGCKRGDLEGMLGRLARVIAGGMVSVGDAVQVQPSEGGKVAHSR